MNRYMMIRRLRGPAFLLLVGVNALMAQAHILGWGRSWPLYLILAGVLALAERAALASEEGYYPGAGQPPYAGSPYPGQPYPGQPYPGQPYPGAPYAAATEANAAAPYTEVTVEAGTAMVPAPPQSMVKSSDGGEL
jgi:hypothetical protein